MSRFSKGQIVTPVPSNPAKYRLFFKLTADQAGTISRSQAADPTCELWYAEVVEHADHKVDDVAVVFLRDESVIHHTRRPGDTDGSWTLLARYSDLPNILPFAVHNVGGYYAASGELWLCQDRDGEVLVRHLD